MFASISRPTIELMLRSLADPSVSRAGVPFHRHIVEGIRTRDAEAARAAVVGHLSLAEQLYGDDYDAPLDDVARREARRLFGSTLSGNLLADLEPRPQDGGPEGTA